MALPKFPTINQELLSQLRGLFFSKDNPIVLPNNGFIGLHSIDTPSELPPFPYRFIYIKADGCPYILDYEGNEYKIGIDGNTKISKLYEPDLTTLALQTDNDGDVEIVTGPIRGTSSSYPDLGSTTTSEKMGNIYVGDNHDIYPDGYGDGVASRLTYETIYSWQEHFRSGVIPAGYSWINDATFGGTPATLNYSDDNDWLNFTDSTQANFLAKAIAGGIPGANVQNVFIMYPAQGGAIGFRVDDGTDTNYELFYLTDEGTRFAVNMAERTGGGVTTQTFYYYQRAPLIIEGYIIVSGATHRLQLYTAGSPERRTLFGNTAYAGWTPARAGIYNPTGYAGRGLCDAFIINLA